METENNNLERFDVDVNYQDEDRGFPFEPDEAIGTLREKALDAFEVREDRELTMLYGGDDEELRNADTLREAGIKAGEVLKLRRREVTVIFNGEGKNFRYNRHETVKTLLDKALSAFNVTVNPHTMSLFLASGVELKDEALTLRDAGVRAGDELFLRTSQVKGGSWQRSL
jgi:hypothetical protein